MIPPANIDSALLKRTIEQWEELLKCHQCHRVVESIAKLWEGENQQSLCFNCCPKLERSIFTCINKPSMNPDDPHASDPGRVVELLKLLLTAYQHEEELVQKKTSTMNNSAIHDKQTNNGVEQGATKNDSKFGANEKLSGHDVILTQQSMSQDCTHTPYSCQERLELLDTNIQCSSPCVHSSCTCFQCQHNGISHSDSAPTDTKSTHHHLQQQLFLSLPETDDFERIFPGPTLTTQTSHQSQTEMHQPDDFTSQPQSSLEAFTSNSELSPNDTSGHNTELVEYQLSSSSRLPETADFDRILAPKDQPATHDHNLTSASNGSPSEELELPATEDFDRIFPMKQHDDPLEAEITRTNDDSTIIPVPGPTLVSPVDVITATRLRERLKDPVPIQNQESELVPIITPMARKKRCHDGHTNTVAQTTKYRKNGDSSKDPGRYSSLDDKHISRRTFPCQVRRHPFRKKPSDLETINICARTFQYLWARAKGWSIEGEYGETIWGDAEVYSQTMAQLSAQSSNANSWIRKAPWWGTTKLSPCPRIPAPTRLLDGYRILLISNRDCDEDSVPHFDFTTLHDRQENDDTRKFKSFALDEMKSLCHAVGVEILEAIAVPVSVVATEKLLIVVAEEIDDEIFKEHVFPRLVERRIIPPQCQVDIPPSFSEPKSCTQVDSMMIPIVYFSWIVQSIAIGIVAPTSPYSLGLLQM